MAVDSAAGERRRARHPGSGQLCPASSAPRLPSPRMVAAGKASLDPARRPTHGARDLLRLQRDLQPDL
jgi:hypothetical protein